MIINRHSMDELFDYIWSPIYRIRDDQTSSLPTRSNIEIKEPIKEDAWVEIQIQTSLSSQILWKR